MKKLISIFVVAALIAVFLMFSVSATEDPQIIVDSAAAAPGEEVVLNVSLVNNPGITNGKITVDYDATVFELVEIDVTPAYAAGFTMALANVPTRNMNFMTVSGNISGDFTLFSLKFKVLETTADGDYQVGLTINKLVNNDNESIPFEVVEGTVSVHTCRAGETVIENVVEPTCTTDGSYDEVAYCEVCDKELSRNTVVVEATGHSYTAVVTEPTCTEDGYTTHTCHCGDSYVDSYVEAAGHEMGQWYFYIASTSKVKGEMRCDCAHCDYYESQYLPYLGDVNGDDAVDTTDAKMIMQYDLSVIGEEDLNLNVGDVNGDGKVDTTDAKLIMQFDLGMVDDLPISN